MGKNLLKIGEMAKLNHISTQTLRLYAKNKLLEPEYLDKDTGYRYYTIAQCAKLDLIKVLKSCRLSLEQIKKIFSLSSETTLIKILENQIGTLSNEIYNLTVSRNNLLRIEKNLKVLNSLPPLGHIFFEYIPERKIDVQETQYDFFAQGHAGYEKMLRHMQNYLHRNKLPPSYFVNIGTIMGRDRFLESDYCSNKVFIFVDELYPQRESLRTIPANMYISIVSNDTSLEPEYARELYGEVQRQNMTPCGDYICEVLCQFPMKNIDQIIYKIQIPVKKA